MKTKTNKKTTHELFRFNLAGVQYSDYQLSGAEFKAGDAVSFFWEKNNKFDKQAIKVVCRGVKIGYVPKNTTEQIQQVMHDYRKMEIRLVGRIISVNKNNPSWNYFVVSCCSVRSNNTTDN